jgi:type III secretory pathway component EscS
MSELERLVREQLQGLGLREPDREDVIAEITGHLELIAEHYRAGGLDEQNAVDRAVKALGNTKSLIKGIMKTKETGMRERFRRMWLPALTVAFFAYFSQMVIARFIERPQAVQVLGNYYAFSRSWLFVVASLAAFGAWWSRALGGSLRERLVVVLAPAEVMAAVIAIVLPLECTIEALAERSLPYAVSHPMVLIVGVLWMLHCAVPSLIGAAPFLFDRNANPKVAAS